mmetsp:Transcript_53995/g.161623  ORF Transcript_53995/g.161623 Transcript_53995/m.161623 type:complete len:276 (-) Transcript_53995:20-847(-)
MKAVNVLFATFSSSLAAMAPAITGASDDDPWARFRDLAKNDEDSNLPDLCGGCHCIPALKKKKKKSKTNTMAPQKPAKRKKCPKKKKVPVTDYPPEVVQILRDQTMNTFLGSDVQVPCVPTSLPPALGPLADQLPKCSDLLIDGGDDAVCGLNYDYSALPEECGSKSRGSRSKSRASSTFDDIDEGCCPASYDLKTYINKKEAKKDDAFITHEGCEYMPREKPMYLHFPLLVKTNLTDVPIHLNDDLLINLFYHPDVTNRSMWAMQHGERSCSLH